MSLILINNIQEKLLILALNDTLVMYGITVKY